MKHFLRNIRGSKLWKRTLALLMILAVTATLIPMDIKITKASTETNIFTDTTITLSDLTLKAVYTDEEGSHVIQMDQNGSYEFPYNADINMRLDFAIGNGNAVEIGKEYIYQLPSTVRVDVEADHQLADNSTGESIGTVHITKDGTLTFVFNDNIIDQSNVPFYVQFDGGLSSDLQEEGKSADISFPTADGSFTIHVDTLGSTEEAETPVIGPVDINKEGTQIVNIDGKNYIEWTVSLGLNGRETLAGTVLDTLPTGLTYARVSGYPKVSDNSWGWGTPEIVDNSTDNQVNIHVSNCHPDYRTKVTFCTYYDGIDLPTSITASTQTMVNNTAVFNPDDGTTGVSDDGTVTIKPDVVRKSGSSIDADGNITWTVVLNAENLDIQGTTYTDIFGTGLELEGEISTSAGTVTKQLDGNGNVTGFTIAFAAGTPMTDTVTIEYKTSVTDFSQGSYKNTAKLTGGTGTHTYNIDKEATVPGLNLISKSCTSWNPLTHTLTWQIIVNGENRALDGVTVTDTFDSSIMSFVSATMDGSALEPTASGVGTVTFDLGNITTQKTITVETRLTEDYVSALLNSSGYSADKWYEYKNNVSMTSSLNSTPLNASANKWVQVKEPELLTKSGEFTKDSNHQLLNDGTIRWTVTVNEPQLTVEGMTFKDILPNDMEYVDGSFYLQNMWEWDDSKRVYLTPTTGTDIGTGNPTISYTFDAANANVAEFMTKQFQIVYLTKVTDYDKGTQNISYTNKASLSVNYEGNVTVEDDVTATVTGVAGGTLDKEYSYKSGTSYVDWTVTVNEAHHDMTAIQNPKISDQLADYFDYVSGTLYKEENGGLIEVTEPYYVSAINNQLVVQMPNIGTDCYVFKFRTQFNCLAAELDGKTIANTVSFEGSGTQYTKTSNTIENVSFSSSSAGSSVKREIRIKKEDSVTGAPLANAEFELWLENVCIGTAISNTSGYATFEISGAGLDLTKGYVFKLKETATPDGYKKSTEPPLKQNGDPYTVELDGTIVIDNCTETALRTDSDGTKYFEITVENVSTTVDRTGDILITKESDAGAELPGAVFGLYTNSTCSVDSRVATRTSDADGLVTFSKMEEGTYYVKEISSPAGYKLNDTVVKVVITYNAVTLSVDVTYTYGSYNDVTSCTLIDEKAVGTFTITKKDAENDTTLLGGAEFGLYKDALCTDLLQSRTTNGSGVVTFNNLELGRTYYYRENKAPSGYVLDNTVHAITIGDGTETVDVAETVTVTNNKAIGNIVIQKVDNSVPAKPLANVEFTLYDSSGTAVITKPGTTNPYIVTTDNSGKAVFENLPFDDYVVKETGGLAGYDVAADVPVTVESLGDTEITVVNNAIVFNVKIIKQDSATSEALTGAVFGLYTSNGIRVKQGTTDANGILKFTDIPYGNYYVQEITAPEGYKLLNTQYPITSAEIDTNGSGYTFEFPIGNEKQSGKITLTKVEENTSTPLANAEFLLYDSNHLIVKKADGSDYRVITNASGSASFENLPYGTYYIEETQAPEGYIRDTNLYKVVVDSDTVVTNYVKEDGSTAPLTIENKKLNTLAPFISFKLKKVVEGTNAPLQDAVFELYADGVGTGITVASNSNGMVFFRRISVEAYSETTVFSVREVSSPSGYKLTGQVDIDLGTRVNSPYSDSDTTPLNDDEIRWAGSSTTATIKNQQILGSIWVTKTGPLSTLLLPNAEVTLYESDGTTPVSGTGIINPVTTNSSGIAVFSNLPVGTYYVKETKAPTGYTVNATPVKVVITGEQVQEVTIKDTPIQVNISKQALGGTTELVGAKLSVHKGSVNGTIVDTWTTTTEVHRVPASVLEVGTTYYLVEETTPNGYGYAEPISFVVNADGSITTSGEYKSQTIVMRDRSIDLSISKNANGVTGELSGATFAVYDENHVEIDRWISGTTAHKVTGLNAPESGYAEYTLRELSAPDGYLVAEDVTFAVSADGQVYTVTENNGVKSYQSITGNKIIVTDVVKPIQTIYIRKTDAVTGLELAGAEFAIYDGSGIPTPLVTWTSNGRPKSFSIDAGVTESENSLKPNKTYVLREISAPQGYVTAEAITFEVDSAGNIQIVDGDSDCLNTIKDTITVKNNNISLKIRKQTGFGTLLKGAELRISEYNSSTNQVGTEIVTFTSGNLTPTIIDGSLLKTNQAYVLQELTAPDGYQLADDIVFTINSDGSIIRRDGIPVFDNTIVMEDEEAGLGIGKVTVEDRNALAGSTLMLTSVDDPFFTSQTWISTQQNRTWNFLDFTPGCTYTLTEVQAPNGYAYTEPVVFTIGANDNQVYIDGVVVPNRTVYIADGRLKLTVSKQDEINKTALAGANLVVLDMNGNQVASWTSGTGATAVDTSQFVAGNGYVNDIDTNPDALKEYILRETKAPESHNSAEDIHFAIDRDGAIYLVTEVLGRKKYTLTDNNQITMYDMPKFSVSKQDIAGEEVPGATLTITTTEDDSFQTITFVSGTTPKYFAEGTFKPGITYTLTETNAPNGYAYAESITFKFDASGTLYVNGKKKADRQAVMVDDAIAVTISKRDITNSKELAGAKLIIKNETGEVIYSFISQNTPTLIPADIFTAPKPGDLQYYSLTELTAPVGYEVAETIFFAIDSEGKIYVKNSEGNYEKLTEDAIVMFDQPSATSDTTVAKGPKTGDAMQLQLVIFLGLISLFCGCVLLERSISKK